MNKKLAIVIPVYNDWISLNILLQKIELCLPNENFHNSYSIIIINDASLIEYTKSNKINYIFSCAYFYKIYGVLY
mgnify:CR=1 FL=1